MKALRVPQFGDPSVLAWGDVEDPVARPDQVVIDVHAAGLNYSDVLARSGRYVGGAVPPYTCGVEAAGVVADTGRRVCFVADGCHAQRVAVDRDRLVEIPGGLTFDEAAALPVSFLTAYHCLATIARAQPGDTVLITAAAGGLGSAAIQVARVLALHVIAAASTAAKRNFAVTLGAHAAIDYRDVAKQRADVVLESVGGRVFTDCLRALRPFGQLVTVGMASGERPDIDPVRVIQHSVSIAGFHLRNLVDLKRAHAAAIATICAWASQGVIRPIVGHTFAMSDAAAAHRYVEARQSQGKVVLVPDREET